MVGVPYTCNGPVNGVRVVGTGSDSRALVHLAAGCTGTLSFDIRVTSGGGDGVKVHAGAHDLTIGPSRIVCDRLSDTSFHQDGVQVQGGTNVTFIGLSIVCPYVTGQGAAGFYIDGKDFSGISNVVCDGCNLEHLHYGAMFTGPAPGSGVRNSVIHQGALTRRLLREARRSRRVGRLQQHARAALRRRGRALLTTSAPRRLTDGIGSPPRTVPIEQSLAGVGEQIVHRDPELVRDRAQGDDGRRALAGLDARDEAARDADPAGELALGHAEVAAARANAGADPPRDPVHLGGGALHR